MELSNFTNMERLFLRESTSRSEKMMKDLDCRINGVMRRSTLSLIVFLLGLAVTLSLSKSPYITCGYMWMPFSLSLGMFAVSSLYLYNSLRLLRIYSAEMECVAAELDRDRRRLLELNMEHDAHLADMAGVWAVPARANLLWGIGITLSFVVLSVPLIIAQYNFECRR